MRRGPKKKSPKTSKGPSVAQHFSDLVENAIDFLDRSVIDLRATDVKFSVVHFYQAIELFVKARLLLEHWTLVVSDPASASHAEFEKGAFQSVDLRDALARLTRIAGEDLRSARSAFEAVRIRRNQVVHFHASEYPKRHVVPAARLAGAKEPVFDKMPPELGRIVAEQCRAWYELNQLLTRRWRLQFKPFRSKLWRLHHLMLDLRPFLQARFDKLQPMIAQAKAAGPVLVCESCGFEASRTESILEGLTQTSCLVCLKVGRVFQFPCPEDDCPGQVILSGDGAAGCDTCNTPMSLSNVADHIGTSRHSHDGDDRSRGYCSDCESFDVSSGSVVELSGTDKYLCLSCLEDHDGLTACDCCNELITGDIEDTYLVGCMHCSGRAGRDSDD